MKRTKTTFAGRSLTELAATFGTPTFLYDAAVFRKQLADLSQFDVVRFAQKACSNLAVLRLFQQAGAHIDAVSAMEVRRALHVGFTTEPTEAGVPGIVYTADIFDRDALELCVTQSVHPNCGSLSMIEQFGEAAPGREITLRINPGFGHGHSQKTNTGGDQSKHGIWFRQLADAMELAAKYELRVTGLHMHIGSGTDMAHLAEVAGTMEKVALEAGSSIEVISCGGGLPIPYEEGDAVADLPGYYTVWDEVRKNLEARFAHRVTLEIEPGRYLTADAGVLLTEVRAVKKQAENLFYLVDAGFNNLARPAMYGSYHPISVVSSEPSEQMQAVIVGGPLCESGDIFTQKEGGFVTTRELPVVKVGDFLLIEKAGAYGSVMSSNYNSRPFAAEVLLDSEDTSAEPQLIRRRQTFEELIALEE